MHVSYNEWSLGLIFFRILAIVASLFMGPHLQWRDWNGLWMWQSVDFRIFLATSQILQPHKKLSLLIKYGKLESITNYMKAPFKKNMYYKFALVSFVSPNDLVESIWDGAQLNEIRLALKKMFPSESMVWCVHDFDGQEHKCQILHQNDTNPHKKVRIHSH